MMASMCAGGTAGSSSEIISSNRGRRMCARVVSVRLSICAVNSLNEANPMTTDSTSAA